MSYVDFEKISSHFKELVLWSANTIKNGLKLFWTPAIGHLLVLFLCQKTESVWPTPRLETLTSYKVIRIVGEVGERSDFGHNFRKGRWEGELKHRLLVLLAVASLVPFLLTYVCAYTLETASKLSKYSRVSSLKFVARLTWNIYSHYLATGERHWKLQPLEMTLAVHTGMGVELLGSISRYFQVILTSLSSRRFVCPRRSTTFATTLPELRVLGLVRDHRTCRYARDVIL